MRQHRYIRLAAALTALSGAVAGTAVIGAAPAGAADECMNVTFPATRLIDWDGYNPKVEYSPTVPVTLAAGSYGVTGSSSDGYPSRVGVTQASEIWELQFLDATGTVIAARSLRRRRHPVGLASPADQPTGLTRSIRRSGVGFHVLREIAEVAVALPDVEPVSDEPVLVRDREPDVTDVERLDVG